MNRAPRTLVAMIVSLVVIAALIAWLSSMVPSGPGEDAPRVRIACAAGVKRPVEAAARAYEEAYGVDVELLYGGSATLLGGLEIKPDSADLYVAADSSYIEDGRRKGLLRESIPVARLTPVIAVATGNPHDIHDINDLLADKELRVGLANPEAAAVGRATRQVLSENDLWDPLADRLVVMKPTVVDVANDIAIGSLDASVLWDATTHQYEEIEMIEDPLLSSGTRTIEVAVVEGAQAPTEALRFARFLSSRDRGQAHFKRHGYQTGQGDLWSERPRIVLFAGSMFNQAIEDTVQEFALREGVDVERVYNGCGILTGQMKAGAQPDAYLSCDVRFLEEVKGQFLPGRELAENPMVMITPPGNPRDLHDLEDLLRPGLRVGLAHPEKSALGALTKRLLADRELEDEFIDSGNWVQQAPQGDFLVNAMRTGSLDAAIVYRSNTARSDEQLEILPLETGSLLARQPWAVSRSTEHRNTLSRLLETLVDERSASRFRALGFIWLADRSVNQQGEASTP